MYNMSDMNFAKRKPDKKFWALVKERDMLIKERDTKFTIWSDWKKELDTKIEKIQDDIDKQYLKMDFEVKE